MQVGLGVQHVTQHDQDIGLWPTAYPTCKSAPMLRHYEPARRYGRGARQRLVPLFPGRRIQGLGRRCHQIATLPKTGLNLYHLKIILGRTAFGAGPVRWHIFPAGTWWDTVSEPTSFLVVDKSTNHTHIFFHGIILSVVKIIIVPRHCILKNPRALLEFQATSALITTPISCSLSLTGAPV